jgi:hypothetical protein
MTLRAKTKKSTVLSIITSILLTTVIESVTSQQYDNENKRRQLHSYVKNGDNSQFVNIPDWDKSEVIDMTELFHAKKIKQKLSDCDSHSNCHSDSYSKGKGKGKGSSKRSRRSQSNGKQKEKGSYSNTPSPTTEHIHNHHHRYSHSHSHDIGHTHRSSRNPTMNNNHTRQRRNLSV